MANFIQINAEHPQPRLIRQVADILAAGGIVAHPTDTTYALGVHMNNHRGVDHLYQIKKKRLSRPLSFLCADLSDLSEYAKVTDEAFYIMKRLLPGPYTFILEARKNAPRIAWTKRKEIGLRAPGNHIVQDLIRAIGCPMISTSASLPTGELLSDPREILDFYGHQIDVVIDAGIIFPEPSTIISFTTGSLQVIRLGKGPVDFLDKL